MDSNLSESDYGPEHTDISPELASCVIDCPRESPIEMDKESVSVPDDEDDEAAEQDGRFLRTARENAAEACIRTSFSEGTQRASEKKAECPRPGSVGSDRGFARLVFRNLPPDYTPEKVRNLIETQVKCADMTIGEITDVVCGRCEVVVEPGTAASPVILKLNGTLHDNCKLTVIKIITADGVKRATEKALKAAAVEAAGEVEPVYDESGQRVCGAPDCNSALARGEVHTMCASHSPCFANKVFDPSICEACKEIFAQGIKGDVDARRLWKNKLLRMRKRKINWVSDYVKFAYFLDVRMSGTNSIAGGARAADGTLLIDEKSFEYLCLQQQELSAMCKSPTDCHLALVDEINHLLIWSARNMKERTKGPQYRVVFKNIPYRFDLKNLVLYVAKIIDGVDYARVSKKRTVVEFVSEEYAQKCIEALNEIIFLGSPVTVMQDTDENEQEEQADEEQESIDIVYVDDIAENTEKVEGDQEKAEQVGKEAEEVEKAEKIEEKIKEAEDEISADETKDLEVDVGSEIGENFCLAKSREAREVEPVIESDEGKSKQNQIDEFNAIDEPEKVLQTFDDINHLIFHSFAKQKEKTRGVQYRVYISDGPPRFDLRKLVVKLLEKVGGIVFARVRRRIMVVEFETEELVTKCLQEVPKFIIKGKTLSIEQDFEDHRRVLEERRARATGEVGIVEPNEWNALSGGDPNWSMAKATKKQLKKQKKAAAKEAARKAALAEETFGIPEETLESLNITLPLVKEVRVSNLANGVTKENIIELLSVAGTVHQVIMEADCKAAVVEMSHPVDAVQAVSQLHSQIYYNSPLRVELYRGEFIDCGEEVSHIPKGLQSIGKKLPVVAPTSAETEGPKLNKRMRRALYRQTKAASAMGYSLPPGAAMAASYNQNTGLMGHSPQFPGANITVGAFGLPILKPVIPPGTSLEMPGKLDVPPGFRGGPNIPCDDFSNRGRKRKGPDHHHHSSFRNQEMKRKNPYCGNPNDQPLSGNNWNNNYGGCYNSGTSNNWNNQHSGNNWGGNSKNRRSGNYGGSGYGGGGSDRDRRGNQWGGGGGWKANNYSDGGSSQGWSNSDYGYQSGSHNRAPIRTYGSGGNTYSSSGYSSSGRSGGNSYNSSGGNSSSNIGSGSYPIPTSYNNNSYNNSSWP
ncbi:RNA recognition motif domain [Trinorchestia longiramus]|nr:RNA recognition motif domain [Trinorchestia longiramus]